MSWTAYDLRLGADGKLWVGSKAALHGGRYFEGLFYHEVDVVPWTTAAVYRCQACGDDRGEGRLPFCPDCLEAME